MRRLLAVLAALAAALVIAPAAFAATYTVNDTGDAPDDNGADTLCDTDIVTAGLQCTLRAAIQQANFTMATADSIDFAGAGKAPAPAAALDPITSQLTIDGGLDTTVSFAATAAGPLFDVQAANSTLRGLTVTGGASGDVVRLGASGGRLDTVTINNAPGNGVRVAGANATISAPEISGASGDGIQVSGDGALITSGHVHGNAGNGVAITGQNDSVSHVVFYGNGAKAIANGGVTPPQNLRIGPRRADGSLPLTGSASGTLELWSGDPSSAAQPSFLDALSVSGDFTYNFASEPAPGSEFSASVTSGGSSEFAKVAVPNDVSSPGVVTSRALDTQNVRVDATEPLDPSSVQKEDFTLTMAGMPRTIDSISVAPDGRFVILTSSGWKAGEAGYVDLGGAGAIADAAGNASQVGQRLRVLAAPGDFIAPLGARLAIAPKTICLTRGRKCRKPGMVIKFDTTEAGKATIVVKRGNVQIGRRIYGNIVAGSNTLKFNGLLGARKLRAGRYRLLMYVQDPVGNVTDQPPIQLFSVRRVTK